MTIPASGPVDFFQLKTEFKPSTSNTTSIGLNELYSGGSYVKGGGFLGIPTTGAIGINNLQGTYDRVVSVARDEVSSSGGTYSDGFYGGVCYTGPVSDNFGNIYIAGNLAEKSYRWHPPLIKKYDTSGTRLWSKIVPRVPALYNGQTELYYDAPVSGAAMNMARDAIFVSYETVQSYSGLEYVQNGVVSKLDLDGNTIWSYEFSSLNPLSNHYIYSNGLGVDSSDNVYVLTLMDPSRIIVIHKFNSNGNIVWARRYQAGDYGVELSQIWHRNSVIVSASGDVCVIGFLSNTSTAVILKWNSSGTFQWKKSLVTSGVPSGQYATTVLYSGAIDSSGNIILLGSNNYGGMPYIAKLDSSGNLLFAHNLLYTIGGYSSTGGTGGMDLALDESGNIYITSIKKLQISSDYWYGVTIAKLNSTGDMQWGCFLKTGDRYNGVNGANQQQLAPTINYDTFTKNLHVSFSWCGPTGDDGYGGALGLARTSLIKMPASVGLSTGTFTNASIATLDPTAGVTLSSQFEVLSVTAAKQTLTTTISTWNPSGTTTDASFTPYTSNSSLAIWQSTTQLTGHATKI